MSKTNIKVLVVMLLCLAFAATAYAASEEKKPVLPLQPPTQEETEKATDKLNKLFKEERPTAKKAAGQTKEKKLSSLTPEAKKGGKTASADTKIEKPVQTAQIEHSMTDKKAKIGTATKTTLPAKEAAKLSALDLLKSDLELLNVKVEIAQKQKRLKELNHFLKPVAAPKVYRFPRAKTQKSKPPVVLSVQGIGDQLTATLQFQSSGKPVRTVSTGDSVAKGTVSTIAHNRVTLTTKNGVIPLPFKE